MWVIVWKADNTFCYQKKTKKQKQKTTTKNHSITLEPVLLQAQQYEATKTTVTSLSQTTEEEVSYMKGNSQKMKQRQRNQKPLFKQNTCPWCGDRPHPKGKDDCPAKGKQYVTHVVDWTTLVKSAYTQIQTGERTEANQRTAALQEDRKQTRCVSQMLSPP